MVTFTRRQWILTSLGLLMLISCFFGLIYWISSEAGIPVASQHSKSRSPSYSIDEMPGNGSQKPLATRKNALESSFSVLDNPPAGRVYEVELRSARPFVFPGRKACDDALAFLMVYAIGQGQTKKSDVPIVTLYRYARVVDIDKNLLDRCQLGSIELRNAIIAGLALGVSEGSARAFGKNTLIFYAGTNTCVGGYDPAVGFFVY